MEYLISNAEKSIKITNRTKAFFENTTGEIYVYGASLCGYWIGYYLEKCGIEYKGYVDKSWQSGEYVYNGKPMYSLDCLRSGEEPKRLIISVKACDLAIRDILILPGNVSCVCLLPVYDFSARTDKIFDINFLLGYFRQKLFKGVMPTVLSNDCTAGMIYRCFHSLPWTPTVNAAIKPDDFIKLCMNPDKYLQKEAHEYFFAKQYMGGPNDVGIGLQIDDISLIFTHQHVSVTTVREIKKKTAEKVIERWNAAIKHINWEKIICVYDDFHYVLSDTQVERFMKVKKKKLLILNRSQWGDGYDRSILHASENPFFYPDIPVEKSFDVLGWMNGA